MYDMTKINTRTWTEDDLGLIDNAGDFGGDIQAGPSYSRQFAQRIEDSDEYVVLTFNGYLAQEDDGEPFNQVQVGYAHCTDLDDIGMSETTSDYRYWNSPIEDDLDTSQGRIMNLTHEDLSEAVNQMGV